MFLKFTKMHGCGNDFMMVDMVSQYVKLRPQLIRKWSDRNFGIGFDQFLVVEPPHNPEADFRYRIYNADGNEVEQCGNGARCFARFVQDKNLSTKDRLIVETKAGNITLDILDRQLVRVDMGVPELEPSRIPFVADNRAISYDLAVADQKLDVSIVSMGNPHVVTIIEDVDQAPVEILGPELEKHERFPKHVNAGFMQIQSPGEIRLRVFERGVGETLACGTGACAAVVAGRMRGLLDEEVKVHLRGGTVTVKWPGEGQSVTMTGPCIKVFEGRVYL